MIPLQVKQRNAGHCCSVVVDRGVGTAGGMIEVGCMYLGFVVIACRQHSIFGRAVLRSQILDGYLQLAPKYTNKPFSEEHINIR